MGEKSHSRVRYREREEREGGKELHFKTITRILNPEFGQRRKIVIRKVFVNEHNFVMIEKVHMA